MTLIDKKGVLFGKINAFDLIVVAGIALVIIWVVFFIRTEETTVFVKVFADNQSRSMAESLSKGDVDIEYNLWSAPQTVAELESFKAFEDVNEGTIYYDIETVWKIRVQERRGLYYFKTKKISTDSNIAIETAKYLLEGTIEKIANEKESLVGKTKEIILEVKAPNVAPEIVDAVKEGPLQRDLWGNVTMVVLEKEERPMVGVNVNDAGQFVLSTDPLNKELVLKLRVAAEEKNETLYFAGNPVFIGTKIQINAPQVKLEGQITKIT